MQLQQLIYFVAVAEQGSFNKAAEKLFTTQPNLSKAIQNLENEINVSIFERTTKGVNLTGTGRSSTSMPAPSSTRWNGSTVFPPRRRCGKRSAKKKPVILTITGFLWHAVRDSNP